MSLDLRFKNRIIILILGMISLYLSSNLMDKNIKNLKIAYSYFEEVKDLDPKNIKDIYQANLIENLYMRLFEYDNGGNLICNLCTSYEVKNNSIYFKIRNDLKTVDNYHITAQDVELSLKRLINTRSNTHGELKYFIDDENSVYSEDDFLIIKTKKPEYIQFILPILTSMDYSIIPTRSLDTDGKIIDYRNTSGPYYVKEENDNQIVLAANPNHINFDEEMPQTINIIRVMNHDAIEKFKNNEVDVIDVTMYPRSNLYRKLFEDKSVEFTSFKTLPMNLLYLGISPLARSKFSKEELYYACKVIREKYVKFDTFGLGHTDAYQFFQGSGNGQVEESDLGKLISIRNKEIIYSNKEKIKLGVLDRSYEKVKNSFSDQEIVEIVSFENDPAFLDSKDQPDLFLQTTDASFTEDINVISYNLNSGNFGLNKAESEKWLVEYLNQGNKETRIEMIKKLQKDFLSKPVMCPLVISPYWAIGKKELKLNFPTQFPGSHWWKIRK